MIWYDMIYLLTAIGLPPGGSSTVHIYTQTVHRTTQNKQYKERHKNFGRVRVVPRLGEFHLGFYFKDPVTVHRDNSLWIKPTDALNSNLIGIMTVHVSGSLSAHHQEFLVVHRLWYILCRFYDRLLPGAGCSSILLLVANGHQICIKCTNADVRLKTPDDGQKGCPKHVES